MPKARTTAQLNAHDAPALRLAFCEALAETGNITKSCEISGLPRRTAYDARNADPDFRAKWDAAIDLGTDGLEDEAVRRGREGCDKPVYQGGKLVGYVREYSDALLVTMLKARRPEKFKDRVASEHTGKDGSPLIPVLNVVIGGNQPSPASETGNGTPDKRD